MFGIGVLELLIVLVIVAFGGAVVFALATSRRQDE